MLRCQAGSNVNAQTAEGWSALHLASKDCRLHVVNALLMAGAESSLVDANGCTALHYAARIGDMTLFQALYRRSADHFRLQDIKGENTLTPRSSSRENRISIPAALGGDSALQVFLHC